MAVSLGPIGQPDIVSENRALRLAEEIKKKLEERIGSRCAYCGSKSDGVSLKCTNCGAPLQ
jgi:hypothetical protein